MENGLVIISFIELSEKHRFTSDLLEVKAVHQFCFSYLISGSSPAAPQPTTAMIMEGLETLVTPSHHAYLLTESAAAAHFNVLSFDTCSLFKTAATTASSYNLNNNNHATTNNNHHSHQQTQLLSGHHQQHIHQHSSQQQQMQQPTIQQSQHQQLLQSNPVNTSNSSNTSSHSATSVTQSKSDSTVVSSSTVTTTTSTSGHHNHPTLNIQETQQQTADRNVQHQQTGDLNTPVTTSGDIPSFFGPSTVVEPPIITGKFTILL